MKTFKDQRGQEYPVHLDVAALMRVRDKLGVNLGLIGDIAKIAARLQADDLFVVEVAAEVVFIGGVPTLFYENMHGDSIGQAATAIQDELADFFRDTSRRETAKKVIETTRQVTEELISGKSSTNSPALPESAPIPIPSES